MKLVIVNWTAAAEQTLREGEEDARAAMQEVYGDAPHDRAVGEARVRADIAAVRLRAQELAREGGARFRTSTPPM